MKKKTQPAHPTEKDCAEHREDIFRYALSMTHDPAVAEDIAQETIRRYLSKTQREDDVENAEAYQFIIAKRLCFDWWKRPKEEGYVSNDDEQTGQVEKALTRMAVEENNPAPRIEEEIEAWQQLRSKPLKIILSDLTSDEWRLLRMHVIDELTPKEIAEIINEDVHFVRYQISKLLTKLRWRARRCAGDEPAPATC